MLGNTKLQKTVKKQRKALKKLLSESMSELANACAGNIDNRQLLEDILSDEMKQAEYCKYLWVLDKDARQLTDDIKRVGVKQGQVGRDRIARPYLQRALKGEDYYLSEAYISRNSKRPSLTAVKTIYDTDGHVSGYLGADFDLRELPHTSDEKVEKKVTAGNQHNHLFWCCTRCFILQHPAPTASSRAACHKERALAEPRASAGVLPVLEWLRHTLRLPSG